MTKKQHDQSYVDAFRHAAENPEGFWANAAQAIEWFSEPRLTYDEDKAGFPMGFSTPATIAWTGMSWPVAATQLH